MFVTLINRIKHLPPMRRQMICIAVLSPALVAVHFAAYWFRFDGAIPLHFRQQCFATMGLAICLKVLVLAQMRGFKGWSRPATLYDLTVLIQGATCALLALAVIDWLFLWSMVIPRGVLLIDWTLTIVTLGGLRALTRLIREWPLLSMLSHVNNHTFIVGDNDDGEALLRAIRRNPKLDYHVTGFITQSAAHVGSQIAGVKVCGLLDDIGHLTEKHGVSHVLIMSNHLSGVLLRRLVEECRKRDVQVQVVPCFEQLLRGDVTLQPRTVSIEDLLRRDQVQLNVAELHRWTEDRVFLITGSAGSIGSEICRQLLTFSPRKLVLVDRSENGLFFLERELQKLLPDAEVEVAVGDITDAGRMDSIFRQHRPDVVFHAAAFKHVPLMEANPGEAVKNIPLATRLLADLSHRYEVSSFVMISTDKAVNPTSVMGTCKRIAELYVQALNQHSNCRFSTVRFGNVLDSAGSVVPIFREQIASGGPVTVTHPKIQRYFMTIPEASQLVIQAGSMGQGGEIFVLDMGEPVRIADLAADMIRLSGLEPGEDIEIRYTGLRPGEKLFEELYFDGEEHFTTPHPKILVAASKRSNFQQVSEQLNHLATVAEHPRAAVCQQLKAIVPQYSGFADLPVHRRMGA